jgi:hypothetical protein
MDSKRIPYLKGISIGPGKSAGSKLSNRQHWFTGFTANCQQTPAPAAVS